MKNVRGTFIRWGLIREIRDAWIDRNVEECWVLTGRWVGTYRVILEDFVRVPNRSRTPARSFTIWDSDLGDLSRDSIMGIAHSHPREIGPSRRDFETLDNHMVGIVITPGRNIIYDGLGNISGM